MDPQLRRRLTHVAQHYPFLEMDPRGDITFGAPTDRACYKEGRTQTIKNAAGVEVTSTLQLYFDGQFPISSADEFSLDEYPRRYPVAGYAQFEGPHPSMGVTVVYLP